MLIITTKASDQAVNITTNDTIPLQIREEAGSIVLGRFPPLNITDDRVSRKQAVLDYNTSGGKLTLTAVCIMIL